MHQLNKFVLSGCLGLILGTGQSFAGAKPDEAHRLSEDLTPMGSERAGNAAGTIPEWTGGITTPPAGYSPASARYIRKMGYDPKTLTAAVVNLAVKGHLTIANDDDEYFLERQVSSEPLAAGEAVHVGGAGVPGHNTLEASAYDWCVDAQERNRLSLHVRTHQGTVGIVMLEKRNQRCSH